MTKLNKEVTEMVLYVRYTLDILGSDGIETQYPFGWVKAEKLVSLDTVPERMDYLLGLVDIYEDYIEFNGGLTIPRAGIENGKFSTVESAEVYPDLANDKDYFTDKGFAKLIEWCVIREAEEHDKKRDSD